VDSGILHFVQDDTFKGPVSELSFIATGPFSILPQRHREDLFLFLKDAAEALKTQRKTYFEITYSLKKMSFR